MQGAQSRYARAKGRGPSQSCDLTFVILKRLGFSCESHKNFVCMGAMQDCMTIFVEFPAPLAHSQIVRRELHRR